MKKGGMPNTMSTRFEKAVNKNNSSGYYCMAGTNTNGNYLMTRGQVLVFINRHGYTINVAPLTTGLPSSVLSQS